MHDVTGVRYLSGHTLEVAFDDGARAVVDLAGYASRGGVFAPLADIGYIKQVTVNRELGTICWPNGADIAPETLYEMAKGAAAASAVSDVNVLESSVSRRRATSGKRRQP